MGKSRDSLTQAEWKVMQIAWKIKAGASRDFCAEAKEAYGWSPSTVKTLLGRLVTKGYLNATRVGNSFLYKPKRTAKSTLQSAADFLLGNMVEGTTGPVLSYMVKNSELSEAEIEELQDVLDQYRKEASP